MSPAPPARADGPADGGRPPLGGWGRLYALVLAALALDVALLAWLERAFR